MRVAYDDALRARLSGDALTNLRLIDRYNLVNDARNAVITGRLAAADFLTFVEAFRSDRDLAVWQAIAVGLRGLGRLVEGSPHAALQQRIADLARPVVADLGWAPTGGEPDLTAKLRGSSWVCSPFKATTRCNSARCRQMLNDATTDPELAATAAAAVASVGTDDDDEDYLQRFRTANSPAQATVMFSLAELPAEDQIRRTIDLALSGDVKTQDTPFLLNRCIANRHNGTMAWESVRRQWPQLLERFPNNTIVRMVGSITMSRRPISSPTCRDSSPRPIPQEAKTLEQLLDVSE